MKARLQLIKPNINNGLKNTVPESGFEDKRTEQF